MKYAYHILLTVSILILGQKVFCQEKNNQKVILVTLDGFRWQELFSGADAKLIANKRYVDDSTALKGKYWRETPEDRRKALMPFIWTEVLKQGELHGNRPEGSKM
ncbi:MAG: phosphoglyceromutase, partial [Leeuwenhoekiella sp.]